MLLMLIYSMAILVFLCSLINSNEEQSSTQDNEAVQVNNEDDGKNKVGDNQHQEEEKLKERPPRRWY